MGIIIGHLIGDYLFQSDWMALNKKSKSYEGLLTCIIHSLIWTVFVYLFGFYTTNDVIIFLLLFISHFILDRWNFVKWFLNTFRIMPNPTLWKIIIVDNTLHLLMVYGILKILA
jgi:hypothetical protein